MNSFSSVTHTVDHVTYLFNRVQVSLVLVCECRLRPIHLVPAGQRYSSGRAGGVPHIGFHALDASQILPTYRIRIFLFILQNLPFFRHFSSPVTIIPIQ